MQTTRYFAEQVLRKRPYLTLELCKSVVDSPIRREVQLDGRIKLWGKVTDPRDGSMRFLRVVLLSDAVTMHNAFFDRNFRDHAP